MKRFFFKANKTPDPLGSRIEKVYAQNGPYVSYEIAAKLARAYRYNRAALRLEYFGNNFCGQPDLGRKIRGTVIWLKLESHDLYKEAMES